MFVSLPLRAGRLHSQHPVFEVLPVVSQDDVLCAHSANYPCRGKRLNTSNLLLLSSSRQSQKETGTLMKNNLKHKILLIIQRNNERARESPHCYDHPHFTVSYGVSLLTSTNSPLATDSFLPSSLSQAV